jgi:hypothetical protein
MITNTGKNILAKYLIGQAPSYASHIAVGCGATPLASDGSFSDYSDKTTLDFEMFRAPIISRGYVNDGTPKIVLTAELPTTERYEMSEIGVYSSGSNPSAGLADSKPLFVFSDGENWEYHESSSATAIPVISSALSNSDTTRVIEQTSPVFITNADNKTLMDDTRIARYESPRYFNRAIFMAGNDCNLQNATATITGIVGNGTTVTYTTSTNHGIRVGETITTAGNNPSAYDVSAQIVTAVTPTTFSIAKTTTTSYVSGGTVTTPRLNITSGAHHIHLVNSKVSLGNNLSKDQLKVAFSIVNTDAADTTLPAKVRLIIEFAASDDYASTSWSRFEVDIAHSLTPTARTKATDPYQQNFLTNRYVVVTKELQDLFQGAGFTWNNVSMVKIYASVLDSSNEPTADFYVALDAVRLENVTSLNPLYGLTGYTVIKNVQSRTIVKLSNTTNLVEFRFALGVGVS